jgi:hypothetical protein
MEGTHADVDDAARERGSVVGRDGDAGGVTAERTNVEGGSGDSNERQLPAVVIR